MKIYLIGQKGIPTVEGGVENHVENLSVRLARAGHEVYVYTRKNYSSRLRKKYQGVNIINLPSIGTKNLDTISYTFLAVCHVIFQKADIIHFHSIGPSSLLWLVKIFKPKAKVAATFHSQCYLHQKWGFLAKAYLKFGEFILCRFADGIITPSMVLQHYTAKRYQRRPVYIPNGVTMPSNSKYKSELKKLGLEEKNYILTVGRLVRHKGVHYLIEAFKKLNTDPNQRSGGQANKKLVIVGDGAYTDDYVAELKARAAGNPNIIFLGNQQGDKLKALFANASLFVQSSHSEGLSVALLEAMSYGLPVLVSDIEENLEAIEDAGMFFKSGSLVDLRKQLKNILSRPSQMNALGKKARERTKENYNWDNLAKEVLQVYRNLDSESDPYRFYSRRIIKNYNTSN